MTDFDYYVLQSSTAAPVEPSQQRVQTPAPTNGFQQAQAAVAPSPLPQQVQQAAPVPAKSPAPQAVPAFPPGVKVPAPQQLAEQQQQLQQQQQQQGVQRPASAAPPRAVSAAFPGSLSDLVISFENVKQKGAYLGCVWVYMGMG